jgi:cbb3-type cytochrome oxidase subunit 3
MAPSIFIPALLLLIGCFAFIFWPQQKLAPAPEKTRLDYLRERKDVLYDNLRDLNFEYRAGKYPEADYAAQRESLETEAAGVIAEIESLGG